MHVPSIYLKGGQRALIKERQRVSRRDPSKLRQEVGTPDRVWFDVRSSEPFHIYMHTCYFFTLYTHSIMSDQ